MIYQKRIASIGLAAMILATTQFASAYSESVNFVNANLYLRVFAYERKDIEALLFRPEGIGPFAAVILLHTCGGQRRMPHITHDWPNYLNKLGYVALVVNSYDSHNMRCRKMPVNELRAKLFNQSQDAFGGLDYLAGLDFVDRDRIAVMGFSTGAISINLSVMYVNPRRWGRPKFKAALAAYGHCRRMLNRGYPGNAMPLLQIIAEHDTGMNASCLAVAKKNTSMQVLFLKNTYHGFDQSHIQGKRDDPHGNIIEYSSEATEKTQNATKVFLTKHLGK
jgi:dienelactone hydrolase